MINEAEDSPGSSDESQDPIRTEPSMRVLTVLGIGTALSLLGDSTLYTVLPDPDNAATVGVTLAAVGILLGANRITRLFTNSLAGNLYDRYSRRKLLIGAMLLGSLCTLIYALGSGISVLLLGRILWGFAWSGIWIGGNTVILDITGPAKRGRVSGLYQTWFFIGVGGSALLGGIFTDTFGLRGGLVISAGLNLLAAILWMLYLPETRPIGKRNAGKPEIDDPARIPWSTVLSAALPTFGMRFVYAGVIASTSILWLSTLIGDGSVLWQARIPLATITGLFVALRTITSMLSGPVAGAISDRLGRRWGVLAGLLLLGGIGTWIMGYTRLAVALAGGFIAAIPGGGIQALIPALVGDRISSALESRALGYVYTFGDLGSALGPLVALGLYETVGLASIYRLCSVLLIALAIMSALRHRSEPTISSLSRT